MDVRSEGVERVWRGGLANSAGHLRLKKSGGWNPFDIPKFMTIDCEEDKWGGVGKGGASASVVLPEVQREGGTDHWLLGDQPLTDLRLRIRANGGSVHRPRWHVSN